MLKNLNSQAKKYIVEEIENLDIKKTLKFIQLFSTDREFKRFLAQSLKDKIMKTNNINMKELMTCILETLDLEDLRGEIIRYALNSEVFYAFPLSYLISLL